MAMTPGGPAPRGRPEDVDLPPGQYWVSEFPALPADPPELTKADWAFSLTTEDGRIRRWDWAAFRALPSQRISVDLHCVTGWLESWQFRGQSYYAAFGAQLSSWRS